MKKLLSILALSMMVACSTPAEANDVADDGKCLDDIKHFKLDAPGKLETGTVVTSYFLAELCMQW